MSRVNRQDLRQKADDFNGPNWLKGVYSRSVNIVISLLDVRVRIINRLVHKGIIKRVEPPLHLAEQTSLVNPIVGRLSVVIIAEVSIPQCYFYRVEQRRQQFEALGYSVSIVAWNDHMLALKKIYTSNLVWFYRVPYFKGVEALYKRAQSLKKPTFFDVDDLIFDRELIKERFEKERAQLGESEYQGLLDGAALYKNALMAADVSVASTQPLADAMTAITGQKGLVLVNGLSQQSFKSPVPIEGVTNIIYGSGTNTHDKDFYEIVPALVKILDQYPNVCLYLVGKLTVSDELKRFSDGVKVYPYLPFDEYQALMGTMHISLAPLEMGRFADAKSEIKWLEASLHGLASVVTRTKTYELCIEQGENGIMCSNVDDWYMGLTELIDDDNKRLAMVKNAQRDSKERYSETQLVRTLDEYIKPFERDRPQYPSIFVASGGASPMVNSSLNVTVLPPITKESQWAVQRLGEAIEYRLFASESAVSSEVAQLCEYLDTNELTE